jgi:hypothetical protein
MKLGSSLVFLIWIAVGAILCWLLVLFLHNNVMNITGSVGWPIILIGGFVVGLIGYRLTRRKPPPQADREKIPEAKTELSQIQPCDTQTQKTLFISYRREDSADVTGRIYDRLSIHFGAVNVFKDVNSIPLGLDFREVISHAVAKASVVVVVVGRDWLGSSSDSENARIHDQTDFVRTEVAAALNQKKPVIPILVSGAKMPIEADLPDEIKSFSYRNGVKVRPDPDFDHDVERLIKGIEQI